MWHRRYLIPWTPLLAVAFVTTTRPLPADDPSAPSDGYKTVVVKNGDKSVAIRVQQQADPLAHASFPDELDHRRALSETNDMANKSFSMPASANPQSNSNLNNQDQETFITKSYNFDSSSPAAPDLNRKSNVSSNSAFGRSATGFDKSYSTSGADTDQNRTALLASASATASEQGRTAVLGNGTFNTSASPESDKVFQGPEADASHRSLTRMRNGQMLVTDLPDRPLTIDEVRELINHGFKPDTGKPPEEPSKPLNDPNYVPEPLRDHPQPDSPPPSDAPRATPVNTSEDDKDDAVPPPGTIAAPPPPENSQPLPQP